MGKTKNVVMSGEATNTKVDKYAAKKDEAKAVAQKHPRHGKQILAMRGKIDKNRSYILSEAIALVKETSYAKFDATVELHAKVRKEGFSTQLTLPHGTGKQKKVELANEETIANLEAGKITFDVLLATADMMPKLVKFAKLLGPRGLMPNPKNGTLVKDEKAIEKFSTDAITVKTEKNAPLIHLPVGKVSMSEKDLEANISAVLGALNKQAVKAYISSSMGPSIAITL